MKKLFILSAVALGALTVGASAADLPRRTVAAAPVMPQQFVAAPAFTWTGFYAGVHAGWAFGSDDDRFGFDDGLFVPRVGGGDFEVREEGTGRNFFSSGRGGDNGGLLGGAQIGVNVQTGALVFGLEADVSLAAFDNGRSGRFGDDDAFGRAVPGGNGGLLIATPGFGVRDNGGANNVAFFNGGGFGGTESIDSFGTIRGRVGVAFDRLLVYGTGGFAWANTDDDNRRGGFRDGADVVDENPGFFVNAAARDAARNVEGTFRNRNGLDDWGWALGGGVEWAFTDNLTAKVEGLYVNFDGRNRGGRDEVVGVSNTGAAITAGDFRGGRTNADFGLIRAGLNFKFSTF